MGANVTRGRSVVDLEGAGRVAMALAMAASTRRIYGASHDRAGTAVRDLREALAAYYAADPPPGALRLAHDVDQLAVDGIPLPSNGPLKQLGALLERRGLTAVVLEDRAGRRSLEELLAWLGARDTGPPPELDGVGLERGEDGARGARGSVDDETDPDDPGARFPEFRMPLRIYRTTAEALDGTMEDVRSGRDLDLEGIRDVSFCIADEVADVGTQALGPAHLVKQDLFTYQHSVNVALITTALLQPFEPDRDRLAAAAQAALLHDIGKCRLPPGLLTKRGRLTEAEQAEVRRHPEHGADILLDHHGIAPVTVEAAYCHHMRDGGHGYPDPRSGLVPGPVTHLVQVADMFEALTAPRPYKAGRSAPEALRTILQTPGMESRRPAVAALAHRLTQSPPGSQVVLSTGERATVVETRPDRPDRPTVRIVTDERGDWLDAPRVVDLTRDAGVGVEKVLLKPAFLCF